MPALCIFYGQLLVCLSIIYLKMCPAPASSPSLTKAYQYAPEERGVTCPIAERQLLPKIAKFAKLIEFSSRQRHFLCYEIFYNSLLSRPRGGREREGEREGEQKRQRWQPHLTPGKRRKAKRQQETRPKTCRTWHCCCSVAAFAFFAFWLRCKINFQFDFK